jgi:hypothetical protein
MRHACGTLRAGVTRHAVTVFLGASNPAPYVKITSMSHPWKLGGLAGHPSLVRLSCVLRLRREAGDTPGCLEGLRGPTQWQARGPNVSATSRLAQRDVCYTAWHSLPIHAF